MILVPSFLLGLLNTQGKEVKNLKVQVHLFHCKQKLSNAIRFTNLIESTCPSPKILSRSPKSPNDEHLNRLYGKQKKFQWS